ncbi:hypothetical protein D910_10971 [Dendroctonus ponderosae]|uniref:Cytochrome P450 n=1 Tax=Dendroctonus ponderosae TaxID=77166 RepID=U4UMG5_DENPD|nr:hypothetical protein D910_10971 [Dendroctonus ponderosae]
MLQPRSAKMYAQVILETAEKFVERIGGLRNDASEMPDNFLNEIHRWSLESLARIALDIKMGCLEEHPPADTQRLIDAINTFFINVPILELKIPFWRVFPTSTFNRYIEALDSIREICLKYINKSMDNLNLEANDDQLSVMQKVLKRENNVKLASILALDLFLVGVDTTSNAVASILYQLSINPKKQQLLHEELDRILPNADSKLTIDKLDEMSYLKACIKETMSNQEEFFSESDKFLPERWLKECQMTKTHHPFACLPFGFGKRMCLGKRFAELEIQTLLATEYGKIVKLSGLVGRPDLLFVYDADEIEKVYRREGPTPFRPSMPCLVKYKSEVRKDFFGREGGVVGVMTEMQDDNGEMPDDFDNEIHKWALECIGRVSLDVRLGCLDSNLSPDSEALKIIEAAKYALRNIAILELRFPFWRYLPTSLWTRYVKNMDYFVE